MPTGFIIALALSTGVGLFVWRMAQRARLSRVWREVGRRLSLRTVDTGRGAVFELLGEVRGAPVAARLIPESTRTPVTIFVGARADARRTGERLGAPGARIRLAEGGLDAQLDRHGLVAELAGFPSDPEVGVRWIQSAVNLYLTHRDEC